MQRIHTYIRTQAHVPTYIRAGGYTGGRKGIDAESQTDTRKQASIHKYKLAGR